METKNVPFAFSKEGIFYFSRRIPADVRALYDTDRISFSLRTRSPYQATTQANAIAAKLDAFWLDLRLKQIEVPGHHRLRKVPKVDEGSLKVSEAVGVYLAAKGRNRSDTFFRAAERAVAYLIEARGDRPLLDYTKADATGFRDALSERGLNSASVVRVFSALRAVVSFVMSETGLSGTNPFSGIYFDRSIEGSRRASFKSDEIALIQRRCLQADDDLRWLVALISDTGLRLAEAAGLALGDIVLENQVPHVIVRPHAWRSLKTRRSERVVPLVGASLWAARRVVEMATGPFAFPRYTSDARTNANSASAALNKWIKVAVPGDRVIHSFRHSLRDRLRAVQCPADIVDQIGGWTTAGEGQTYGSGYPIEVLKRWMVTIVP